MSLAFQMETSIGIKTVMSVLRVFNLLRILVTKNLVFHGHGHTCEIKNMRHRQDNFYAEGCLQMLVAETRQTTFDSHVP